MAFTRDWLSSWILDHSKFKTQPSYVRGLMDDVGERLAAFLYGFTTTETFTGFKKVSLVTIGTGSGTIPTGTGVQAAINMEGKTVGGKVELITIDADGNELQLTSKGAHLANDAWLKANALGTGANVEILKINTANQLEFNSALIGSGAAGLIPRGGIIMWSGSVASIPTGWYLCNGSNGTPNLTDRFIIGAGSTYAVAGTGGEALHTLSEAEMPAHVHTFEGYPDAPGTSESYSYGYNLGKKTRNTSSVGSGTAHNNLPPYYALAFIMKG